MSDSVTEHDEITDRMTESLTDNDLLDKSPQYSVVSERDAAPPSSSSSDSESVPQLTEPSPPLPATVQENVYRLFGREKPVHEVLGGGKPAGIFLWRNKKVSGSVLAVATAIWVLFELLECHLLTLVCHITILVLSLSFLWSNASVIIHKKSPRIPEVHLPENNFLEVASALRVEINHALDVLRDIASGRDLKKFLAVIFSLWFLSVVGSFCSFLTLCYISFVSLLTVPVLYEKYDDKIDAFAKKAAAEMKKQYAVLDEKVLSKIPMGPLGQKKRD